MKKAVPSIDEKKMEPEPDTLTYRDASGQWTVNVEKLRRVLEAEGIEDLRSVCEHSLTLGKRALMLMTVSQVKAVLRAAKQKQDDFPGLFDDSVLAVVRKIVCDRSTFYAIHQGATHQSLVKWVKGIRKECIICFEDEPNAHLIKDYIVECRCGAGLCVGCTVDLLLIADTQMTLQCPNCRFESGAMRNWHRIAGPIVHIFQTETKQAFGGFSAAQLAFFRDSFGVDFRRPWRYAMTQMRVVYQFAYDSYVKHGGVGFIEETPAALQMEAYKDVLQYIEGKRAKKKVATASADGGVTVAVSSDGCANCGKQFWDKCEKKRAPKCPKCKRTAYCSAKCRKKHRKTHASECRAAKPKRKGKAKKKPKKGGCAPY